MKKSDTYALSMDVVARDGTLLRLTVHRTCGGYVDLDNLLEISEHCAGRLRLMVAYTVQGFLAAADDHGRLTLHDGVPSLVIERDWMTAAADWLQMLDETREHEEADPRSWGTVGRPATGAWQHSSSTRPIRRDERKGEVDGDTR